MYKLERKVDKKDDATTYVRIEIDCKKEKHRLVGFSGFSPEKAVTNLQSKKLVPAAYEWKDINSLSKSEQDFTNQTCKNIESKKAQRAILKNCFEFKDGAEIAKCLNGK